MAWTHPTRTQLRQQAASDMQQALPPGADPLLRFSNLGITGTANADFAFGVYGYIDYVALQCTPFTATDEYLVGWAALKNVIQEQPGYATGSVSLTTTGVSDIPIGTSVVRGDQFSYVTTADQPAGTAGTVTIPIKASETGSLGNAQAGTLLTLGAAINGVASNGSAAGAITGGVDLEDQDALRGRMLSAYAAPAQGGAPADYINWALDVPGVTRAWVNPNGAGPGTVVVYPMLDVAEAAFGGFPQGTNGAAALESRWSTAAGDQLTIANSIFPLRPVTALVLVYAPTQYVVNFTLTGLTGASTATKAAIAAAITATFLRLGSVGGALQLTQNAAGVYSLSQGGTVDLSYVNSAIAAVTGTTPYVMTSPTTNIVCPAGALPVLGTITYA